MLSIPIIIIGLPALNVTITKNIEDLSIILQWNEVDDSLHTYYTIHWGGGFALVEEVTSYTITGLILNTVYTITISPANACGDGPEFRTTITFSPDTTSTTSTISPTVTASTTTMTIISTTVNPSSSIPTIGVTDFTYRKYSTTTSITITTLNAATVITSTVVIPTPTTNPADGTTCACASCETGASGLSTAVAVVIAIVVTFILTLIVTAIITFIMAYVCVKRTFHKAYDLTKQPPTQEKALYEQVCLPSHTVTKNDLELQPNPAYGTSHKVIMDTNPAYESCK